MQDIDISSTARAVIAQEAAAVAALAPQIGEGFVAAARAMLACRGHVLVAGSGTSHAVALRLAHLLSCCGTPALFLDPGDAQHGLARAVTANDLLMVISKGGETKEINYLAQYARAQGAQVVALTEAPGSTLGKMSSVIVPVQSPKDADPYGMIATGSSLVNSALGDALCVVLLKLRGYTQEEFARTHPGGAVGVKCGWASQEKRT